MLVLGIRAETPAHTGTPPGPQFNRSRKHSGGNPKVQGELVETWIGLWIILLFVTIASARKFGDRGCKRILMRAFRTMLLLFFVLAVSPLFGRTARAQNQELQQHIAEIKQAAAKNKQALAQYTWVEQVNISLKGEQKKQE